LRQPGQLILQTTTLLLALLISSSLLSCGCISAKRTPNLDRIFAQARASTGKRPIIVIPGVLGSELINSKTGETVWPSAFRSSDDGSTLPLSPDLASNRDNLVPGKIIETVRLARILPEVYVYRDLLDSLRHYGGYREGDWNNPSADGDKDTFYVFAYDWRRDNVENARALINRIEDLKHKLKRADLRFNILAHSMGGLVARYAAMYGDVDISPEGQPVGPTWAGAAHINKIIMLGVPNEGSADAFASLLYGYSITEGLRRRVPLLNKFNADDAITSPALFQLLPHGKTARFLDEELKPLQINIYDPAMWKLYGWSAINDPEFRKRHANRRNATEPAETSERSLQNLDAYLAAVLNRAKRFHEVLDATSDVEPPVILLALGGDCEETLDAPLVLRDTKLDRWVTLVRPRGYRTSTGRRVTEHEAIEAMYAPGDGRVTRRSLLGEDLGRRHSGNIFDSPLALTYAIFGCDLHGALQKNKILQDNALSALVSEAMK
jgi:pimeloyl-ACP methyl ester carboxylesterase